MSDDENRRILNEMIKKYNRDPDETMLPELFERVKKADPRMYEYLSKCQCAYAFHMILESILNSSS